MDKNSYTAISAVSVEKSILISEFLLAYRYYTSRVFLISNQRSQDEPKNGNLNQRKIIS
ncbi:MAG: hypothetical protein AAGF26_02580 [Cyanobacteria bacterium P01_G01_bin.49]